MNLRYLPDLKDGGSLSEEATAEARAYVPISRRFTDVLQRAVTAWRRNERTA